jgi:tetratricopeptide (TPR) repeat protein
VNTRSIRKLLPPALLLALGIACYANSFRNEFVWDDNFQIVENRLLRSWAFVPQLFTSDIPQAYQTDVRPVHFYRPLWMLSQLVDYQLWGPHPWGFHLTNLLLHVGNGLLFFALMMALGIAAEWALLAAAIFVCHPVHLETTTFIAGRTGEMSVFFMLASLLLFVRFAREDKQPAARWPLLFVSLAAFAAALLSKETAVTLPGDILAVCLLVPLRSCLRRRRWWLVGGYVSVLAAYLVVRTRVLSKPVFSSPFTRAERGVLVLRALAAQIGLAIAPVNLHVERTLLVEGWRGAALTGGGFVCLLLLAVIAARYYHRDRRVVLGIAFFLIGFSLTSNLIPLNTTFGERWLYWPMPGLLLAGAAALEGATTRNPFLKRLGLAAGWCLVIVFCGLTIAQNRVWHDDVSLYETAIARGGDTVRVRGNLGFAFLQEQQFDRAREEFETALQRAPRDPVSLRGMGRLCAVQQQNAQAKRWLEQALAADPRDTQASIWLAYVQEQEGTTRDAEQTLRAAVAHTTASTAALQLADLYIRQARLEDAGRILRTVLQRDPLDAAAHNSLGRVLFKQGDMVGAEQQFRLALRCDRWMVDAHANLAAVAASRQDWAKALGQYEEALEISPSNADLYYALGVVFTRIGDVADAHRALARAIELDPQLAETVRQEQQTEGKGQE